jgi:hypothetical protein
MPTCGLLGAHQCISIGSVWEIDLHQVCPVCLVATRIRDAASTRDDSAVDWRRRLSEPSLTTESTADIRAVQWPSNVRINIGAEYKLVRSLSAVQRGESEAKLRKLPPGAVITVAGVIRGSPFIEVSCGGLIYEVIEEDAIEAAEPHSGLEVQ